MLSSSVPLEAIVLSGMVKDNAACACDPCSLPGIYNPKSNLLPTDFTSLKNMSMFLGKASK